MTLILKNAFNARTVSIAILPVLLIGFILMAGCAQAGSSTRKADLREVRSNITHEITPGLQLKEAKNIMESKYNAKLSQEDNNSSSPYVVYTIQNEPDRAGVYGILVVTIRFNNDVVSSVETDLEGMGL